MMCQLSMSNSSLLRENESFRARFQLRLLPGEKVDLSQFRGIELGLIQRDAPNLLRRPEGTRGPLLSPVVLKEDQRNPHNAVDELSELVSTLLRKRVNPLFCIQDSETDRQSDSSRGQNERDKEELRVAMLKCITKSKYDDVDDYLQWLNDCSSTASKLRTNRDMWSEHLSDVDELERVGSKSEDCIRKEHQQCDTADQLKESLHDMKKFRRAESETRVPTDPSSNSEELTKIQRSSPKQRTTRHRAMSVGCNKMNGFVSARQNGNTKKAAPRRSLANLSSMRANSNKSPRRNLI
ncbi:unnamed protein product [Anisakis simplex]|uniref:Uncharacterized protein n=1 Tax=Anisakis simplex TaxID=6269 RepID=A0A3P6R110_ANISI|nr:unnamed protein product [Anisakis simplex]